MNGTWVLGIDDEMLVNLDRAAAVRMTRHDEDPETAEASHQVEAVVPDLGDIQLFVGDRDGCLTMLKALSIMVNAKSLKDGVRARNRYDVAAMGLPSPDGLPPTGEDHSGTNPV